VAKPVSQAAVDIVRRFAESRGLSFTDLARGVAVDAELEDPTARFDWGVYAELLDRVARVLGGTAAVAALGELAFEGAAPEALVTVARALGSGALIGTTVLGRFLGCCFGNVTVTTSRSSGVADRVLVTLGADDRPSDPFAHLVHGLALACARRVPGCTVSATLAPARMELEFSDATRAASPTDPAEMLRTLSGLLELGTSERVRAERLYQAALDRQTREAGERRRLEEQLLHAQRMESLGRLAGGVAHDFNNMLVAILSFASFASDSIEPEHPARSDIAEIVRAAEQARGLTSQLLAFSRRQFTRPRVTTLAAIVLSTERLLRRVIGADVALVTSLADQPWCAEVDAGHFEQVLMNLAVNSRDAMPRGGRLTVAVENLRSAEPIVPTHGGEPLPPGDFVVLRVSDDGAGMTPDVLARAFEPFFTTKTLARGTGLGLSMCLGIVTQAGGKIRLTSKVGQGTSFEVVLPRANRRSDESTRDVAVSARSRGGEVVLLAEDDATVRAVAARALRAHGYTVLEAADGMEALAVARAQLGQIHLLVTDIVMPRMSGPELAATLRAERPSLEILYTTGYAADLPGGAVDPDVPMLEKPFTPDQLVSRARETLDQARPAD